MTQSPIRQVAIAGGTHGNEWTGIYLVKKFQQMPELIQRSTLRVQPLLANLRAIEQNCRYVERDLNRCFGSALDQDSTISYEGQRARAIAAQLLSPQAPTDFILDIHSTTANMGLTLLPASDHPFNRHLFAYLCERDPTVRVCLREPAGQDALMLRSLVPLGCTLEVGPVPTGVLSAVHLQAAEQLIHTILDYLEAYNQRRTPPSPETLTVYQAIADLDYPRDSTDALAAIIHPQRQGQDYAPLSPDDPLFLTWAGETIRYTGETVVYPVFVNEAAYYEKHIAMVLTQKLRWLIPADWQE